MRIRLRFLPVTSLLIGLSLLYTGCSDHWKGLPFSKPAISQPTPTPPPVTEPSPLPSPIPSTPPPDTKPPTMPQEQPEQLVVYQGPVEHIFFHPLIAYPELAFDGDAIATGYNDWFVTIEEFNQILDSLYAKDFILIDIHLLESHRELRLPPGKKPLILSVDDINYYDYMRENGNVYKLVLDDEGNIATESITPAGQEEFSHENEIVPILDTFVQHHPDFSFQGAKGVLALTGYEGILGYRTNLVNSPNYQREKAGVLPIVQRLKETGWTFASHGYGHLNANQVSTERFLQDTEQWKKEVEPLIGETSVYIYPFGSRVPRGGEKFQYLLQAGFDVLCSVGPRPFMESGPGYVMMDRRHIDGISLHDQRESLLDLFDSAKLIDPRRPEEY